MPEETITEEIQETVEVSTEENQVIEEKKEPAEETPTETTVDDIVSGKKGGIDQTPAWAKKRFDELTAKIYEKDRRIKELEEAKKSESIISSPEGRPVLPIESDFIDMEDYRKARIQYEDKFDIWKSNQRQSAELQERQKQERESNLISFNDKASRMREKYADFDVAINEPVFTQVMGDEITASEYGPEIGYYLAKNHSEALRLRKLTPNGVAKEIGKLEVKFSQAIKRTNSNAPVPLIPIKGDDIPTQKLSEIKDADEWYKRYRQEKLKKIKF